MGCSHLTAWRWQRAGLDPTVPESRRPSQSSRVVVVASLRLPAVVCSTNSPDEVNELPTILSSFQVVLRLWAIARVDDLFFLPRAERPNQEPRGTNAAYRS